MTPISGDVILQIGPQRWTLRLDFNAFCLFEGLTAKAGLVWLGAFERGEVVMATELRAMLWAALQRHHVGVSLEEAGDILQARPDALQAVVTASLPEASAQRPERVTGKKPKAPPIWRRFFRGLWRRGSRSQSSGA